MNWPKVVLTAKKAHGESLIVTTGDPISCGRFLGTELDEYEPTEIICSCGVRKDIWVFKRRKIVYTPKDFESASHKEEKIIFEVQSWGKE